MRDRHVAIEDDELHRAAKALRQQADLDAIREGMADMEADRFVPFDETDARIRAKQGLPPRT